MPVVILLKSLYSELYLVINSNLNLPFLYINFHILFLLFKKYIKIYILKYIPELISFISRIGLNEENNKIGHIMINIKIITKQQPWKNFSVKSLDLP